MTGRHLTSPKHDSKVTATHPSRRSGVARRPIRLALVPMAIPPTSAPAPMAAERGSASAARTRSRHAKALTAHRRALKTRSFIPADLSERIEAALRRRARRLGLEARSGSPPRPEKVETAAARGRVHLLITPRCWRRWQQPARQSWRAGGPSARLVAGLVFPAPQYLRGAGREKWVHSPCPRWSRTARGECHRRGKLH